MIAVGDLHSIIALKCPGCLLHIISIKSLLLIFIYGPTCVVGPFFLLNPAVIWQKSTPVSVRRVLRADDEIGTIGRKFDATSFSGKYWILNNIKLSLEARKLS